MKFLVIQTAFIGDVILATPVLEKLRRFFPAAEIDVLVRRGNERLLAGHPHLRQVLVWDKKQRKYRDLMRLLGQIREEQYDWVINCQRFAASGLLTAFSGAAHTAGFAKNPFSRLFNVRIPHLLDGSHEVSRNLRLIEHLTDTSLQLPRLYPSAADEEKARALSQGAAYICIAPTSVWFTKQFPAHKWVEFIQRLAPDLRVFLLGGPEDTDACEQIRLAGQHTNAINLAGQLSLLASAALMQGAAMNYANDSAPIHLASAVNAPMTAVFCSTVPAFGFTPLAEKSQVVETLERLPCRPCGLHGYRQCPLGHFACAETIAVSQLPLPLV